MFGYSLVRTSELDKLRNTEWLCRRARQHDANYKKRNEIPEWIKDLIK